MTDPKTLPPDQRRQEEHSVKASTDRQTIIQLLNRIAERPEASTAAITGQVHKATEVVARRLDEIIDTLNTPAPKLRPFWQFIFFRK